MKSTYINYITYMCVRRSLYTHKHMSYTYIYIYIYIYIYHTYIYHIIYTIYPINNNI